MLDLRHLLLIALALAIPGAAAAQQAPALGGAPDGTLSGQLRSLSEAHGFQVQGLDKVVDAPAGKVSGQLSARLRSLLDRYNHVIEGTATEVTRVIILSAKTQPVPGIALKTRRQGSHHSVRTTLNGPSGRSVRANLLVDTGASTLVLPTSLMKSMGFRAEDLPEREAQTVNGEVRGKFARLEKVSIGAASATDVEVLFVDDDQIGETGLLGMSFLKHFTMTINDVDNRLLLKPR